MPSEKAKNKLATASRHCKEEEEGELSYEKYVALTARFQSSEMTPIEQQMYRLTLIETGSMGVFWPTLLFTSISSIGMATVPIITCPLVFAVAAYAAEHQRGTVGKRDSARMNAYIRHRIECHNTSFCLDPALDLQALNANRVVITPLCDLQVKAVRELVANYEALKGTVTTMNTGSNDRELYRALVATATNHALPDNEIASKNLRASILDRIMACDDRLTTLRGELLILLANEPERRTLRPAEHVMTYIRLLKATCHATRASVGKGGAGYFGGAQIPKDELKHILNSYTPSGYGGESREITDLKRLAANEDGPFPLNDIMMALTTPGGQARFRTPTRSGRPFKGTDQIFKKIWRWFEATPPITVASMNFTLAVLSTATASLESKNLAAAAATATRIQAVARGRIARRQSGDSSASRHAPFN